ncbi:MAG: single-stranded-DNA-specific exonuclease RecJ [Thiobacillaceae bacterium]
MLKIQPRPIDPIVLQSLVKQGVSPTLARLYAARGVASVEETQARLGSLLPFESLKGIQQTAVDLADAIEAEARMLIVADYDADGATACAIGIAGLRQMGAQADFLVPNRMKHGYGLSPAIMEEAARLAPDLLITVDNGIAAIAGVDAANQLGIPVYVTDHHLPGDQLPDAAAIVNPNQPGCSFPSKNVAGVGVMFYVLAALRAELRRRGTYKEKPEPDLRALLDRVALGTVADVVKLDANNRIFVTQGLERIRSGMGCPGIQALFQVSGRDCRKASVFDLGFMLGPRLNAAGRLDDMSVGIECLLAPSLDRALPLARQLHDLNQSRKEIEADMQAQALSQLSEVDCTDKHGIAVFHPDWHAGVVGILASRIKEQHHRPVIAFAPGEDGELKGSGRSIPALHLRDALDWVDRKHPGLMNKFGGHAMAAGLTLDANRFTEFQAAFESVAKEWLSPEDLEEIIETDGELNAEELNLDFARSMESGVWGQGFPAPLFEGQFKVTSQKVVGEKHLRLTVELGQQRHTMLAFFRTELLPERFLGIYAPMINEFNGAVAIQLKLHHWES